LLTSGFPHVPGWWHPPLLGGNMMAR
jgi:hypothetical protein